MRGRQVGVDIGGTFTDLAVFDPGTGAVAMAKSPTTPDDFARGLFDVLAESGVALDAVGRFVHGTTIATNAVVERRGATVGLLTTKGFRDTLEIMRINRERHYDLQWSKPVPLVPRRLRFGVAERVDHHGRVLTPLDEDGVRAIARRMRDRGVEAVAICFLFSFMNPDHEDRAAELVREVWPDVPVSVSHEILPEIREYERTSTVVADAYVKPLVGDYLATVERELRARGLAVPLTVMSASGGVLPASEAVATPVATIHSGPAGGVIGAAYLGATLGEDALLAVDAGGTSFEVSVVNRGRPASTTDGEVEWGIPFKVPMIDVKSIGAGGGSIARVDAGGLIQVGPDSAGASPGPACYGRGGRYPTLTDAFVAIGGIDPDYFLGGRIRLDADRAAAAVREHVAEPMSMSTTEAALGIITVARASMAGAMRVVSTQRGYDPRDYALVAYGGAGPLIACDLARELSIDRVVVPPFPGAFCAFGALCADVRFDFVQSYLRHLEHVELDTLARLTKQLEDRALAALDRVRVGNERLLRRTADLRYVGQNYEVNVAVPDGEIDVDAVREIVARFNDEHRRRYGHRKVDEPIEFVSLRVAGFGVTAKPRFPTVSDRPRPAAKRTRDVVTASGAVATVEVYERADLPAGWETVGPLVVEEPDSTVIVGPGDRLRNDGDTGCLLIDVATDGG